MHCGAYLIRFIPRENINEWLDRDDHLSKDEIDQLYSPIHYASTYSRYAMSPNYQQARRKLWDWKAALGIPLLATLIKFLMILVPTLLLVLNNLDLLNDPSNIPDDLMYTLMIIEICFQPIFILVPYYALKFYLPPNATYVEKFRALGIPVKKISKKQVMKEILLGLLLAAGIFFLEIAIRYISAYLTSFLFNASVEDLANQEVTSVPGLIPGNIGSLILIIVLMFVSIGPSEEILFRGFAQTGFKRTFGKSAAIWITAFYFALFHIYATIFDPVLFFYLFIPYIVISLMLGMIYEWRGNLIAVIVTHAVYNSIQFIIMYVTIAYT